MKSKSVEKYYSHPESKLGYWLLMGHAKHFGYYPNKVADISEKRALAEHQNLIAKTLSLKSNERVLDAGCGRGMTACYIAEKYDVNVVGIDLLDFELKIAGKEIVKRNLGNRVSVQEMDYSELDFDEESFDAIYTSETLSHAQDILKVLQEFYRVLKPGGRAAFLEYTLAQDNQFSDKEMDSLNFVIEGSAMAGLKAFRHEEFLDVLESVGFQEAVENNITDHVRPSFERLYTKSKNIYKILKLFGLERLLINTATPTLLRPLIEKDLIRYSVFSATKAK